MGAPLAPAETRILLQTCDLKQCPRCMRVLPTSSFYTRSAGCKSNPGAPYSECKACHNGRTKGWRERHPLRSVQLMRKHSRAWDKRNRVKGVHPGRKPFERRGEVQRLREWGLTHHAIALLLQCTVGTVRKYLR